VKDRQGERSRKTEEEEWEVRGEKGDSMGVFFLFFFTTYIMLGERRISPA